MICILCHLLLVFDVREVFQLDNFGLSWVLLGLLSSNAIAERDHAEDEEEKSTSRGTDDRLDRDITEPVTVALLYL